MGSAGGGEGGGTGWMVVSVRNTPILLFLMELHPVAHM